MSLVEVVRRAGVIGCGGAGFPTHVKINTRVGVVIANGAECEPLLNSDQRVMELYADELLEGLQLIMDQVGATQGYIGLKRGYHKAIEALSARLMGSSNIQLGLLGNFYPAGDEHILLTELTGRIVPEGGLPLHVGAVVSNVLTMVQVARAARGKNVTERLVTLAGEVEHPQVVNAPIGTPVADLLSLASPTIPLEDIAVLDGGPMMGRLVDLRSVVNKTTSGLLFLHRDHPLIRRRTMPLDYLIRRSVASCCQCRYCTEVCSRRMQGHQIEPHLMMRTLAYNLSEPTRAMTAAFLCSQCGLCEFACPMDLSPRRAFSEILDRLRSAGVKSPHQNAPSSPHEFREYRKMGKDRLIRRYQLSRYDSHDLPLTRMSDPRRVFLALKQSTGAPSEPAVQVGDYVAKGDLVARIPEGKLGSNLHASISGRVVEINRDHIVVEGGR